MFWKCYIDGESIGTYGKDEILKIKDDGKRTIVNSLITESGSLNDNSIES
jgi:hypothetical protein